MSGVGFAVVGAVGCLCAVCAHVMLGSDASRFIRAGPRMARDVLALLGSTRRQATQKAGVGRRRSVVLRQMPMFLDMLTLGLCAGMSFDASVEMYCKRYQTELCALLWDAMLSWRMGLKSRGEALRDLANVVDAPAMTRFAATVEEALSFGTPLSAALERQAQVIRDEQRAQTEEEIERVPVKMLIPLGALIVPAMLLAILGPLLGPALATG